MTTQLGQLARYTYEVTDKLYNLLNDNKEELQLESVWYGPQRLIPTYPCIVLEPRPKRRRFNGTRRWDLEFNVAILLYHSKVQDSETLHRENEEQAILVESFLHQHMDLDGLVIFGYVITVEPGLVTRGDVMITSTRLTWQGTSREEF